MRFHALNVTYEHVRVQITFHHKLLFKTNGKKQYQKYDFVCRKREFIKLVPKNIANGKFLFCYSKQQKRIHEITLDFLLTEGMNLA